MIRTSNEEEIKRLPWLLDGMLWTWTRWKMWDKWPPLVYEYNDEIWGVVMRRLTRKGIALDWIVIEPSHRNMGIANQMLRHVVLEAINEGYMPRMYLVCAADSPAERFWSHWLQATPYVRTQDKVRFSAIVEG